MEFRILPYISKEKSAVFGSLIPGIFNFTDRDNIKKANELLIENDWNRMMTIFKKNDYGETHPALMKAFSAAGNGGLLGGLFGGIMHYRKYYNNFVHTNDDRLFLNLKDAQRTLVRHSSCGFVVGALKVAPLFALFMGGFSLLCSCIQLYRNKVGIIEYGLGGCGIGSLFRINYGIRGMFVGSIFGGMLGTVYGILYCGIIKLFGLNENDLTKAQYTTLNYGIQRNHDKVRGSINSKE